MKTSLPIPLGAVVLLAATFAEARQFSPRVISPHVADTYSMKTFAQYHRWRDLDGNERAWEVFKYLTDERTGLFPLGKPVIEGNDVLSEYQQVRDPVKLINVYGYGYCGILGPTAAGVCEQMGIGRSRTVILPGWHHVVGETFYDGRWHYLDLDVRAAFRRADGRLASMAEAQQDDSLWKRNNGPRFFPLDPLERVREVYRKTPVHHYHGYHFGGHTMDYVLRQGESFKRWWTPQGGRWNHAATYHENEFFQRLLEREPRGPKCKHGGWSVHAHGNGRFLYEPNLTSESTDFEDGVYDSDNVQLSRDGLTLKKAGEGYAVLEVRSPYVIVPIVGKMDTVADDREASVVQVAGTGATLSISLDHGITWHTLPTGRQEYDLTPYVSGRYGYLLKLILHGQPAETVLRSLKMTTWVQVAPASLPALRKGVNRMQLRTGDHYGLPTRVVEIRTNGSDREDFLKYLHEAPASFDPRRKTARAKGAFIVKLPTPPRSKFAWFSAGGNFNTHQGEAARQTKNEMAYAVNKPASFKVLHQADVPADQAHWHYNADREVKLDEPASAVYLRYVGDPGVNNLRIYGHAMDDKAIQDSPLVVTHRWKEGGQVKSKAVELSEPAPYEIIAEAEPTNVSIELAIPSKLE